MIWVDTESVGKTGPLVLIQMFITDGQPFKESDIFVHYVWDEPVKDTLALIEAIANHSEAIVGFNLAHDWFVLSKWYNIFRRLDDVARAAPPDPRSIKLLEAEGPQPGDVCIKPRKAVDLMLIARAGKYQYLAKHKPVTIRKVPRAMCDLFIKSLQDTIHMPPGVSVRWRVSEKRSTGHGRQDVCEIVGEFDGLSTSLKHLHSVVSGRSSKGTFEDRVGHVPYKDEPDWRPWGGDWIRGLSVLRRTFATNPDALQYAIDDITYTYELWQDLGSPSGDDDDSQLACLVGACQWKGFAIASNEVLMEKLREYVRVSRETPTSPNDVYCYLRAVLDDTERLIVTDTKKQTIEELARWQGHPVQERAKAVTKARSAQRRTDLLRKLIKTKRLHFAMKVLGTLSSRMSGGSESDGAGKSTKLNIQGIPREKEIRSLFLLAFNEEGEHLEGGDFDAFEVSIADAVYTDPKLHTILMSGSKIHTVVGTKLYNLTAEQVNATKGSADDKYTRSKNCFFAWLYLGSTRRIAKTGNVEEAVAEELVKWLAWEFPEIAKKQKELVKKFTPLQQPMGPGTEIFWTEPEEYAESLLGFRRYFTLEWAVIRGLYKLANHYPPEWDRVKGEIRRTNRLQTMAKACCSALYAAIFGLQGHIARAAANHYIQSPGAQITKKLQRNIWELQPHGVNPWIVRPVNAHDEVLCPTTLHDNASGTLTCQVPSQVVATTIHSLRNQVPLLSMTWKTNLKSWGEK